MARLPDIARTWAPRLVTGGLVVVATLATWALYRQWTAQPWTRDAQVRADIIKVVPRVGGYVVDVHVRDNDFVKRGDPLFTIDPETYDLAVASARFQLEQAREEVASLNAAVSVAEAQLEEAVVAVASSQKAIAAAEADVESARASVDEALAAVTAAKALIDQRIAELDNAKSEAVRAKKLVERDAGSVEDAESAEAMEKAKTAQLASARAGSKQAESALAQARSGLSKAEADLLVAKDDVVRSRASKASAEASLEQAEANRGLPGEENVRVRSAQVALDDAELNQRYTSIVAPCDGYVTNLAVQAGTFASVGQPLVAVVDAESFRVHAYFQETKLPRIGIGDVAVVTLMSHPGVPIGGKVEKVGRAVEPPNVAPTEGQPGEVPQIEPTFDWVRLPQRVPVTINLDSVPKGVKLISGTTASVAVRPRDAE